MSMSIVLGNFVGGKQSEIWDILLGNAVGRKQSEICLFIFPITLFKGCTIDLTQQN